VFLADGAPLLTFPPVSMVNARRRTTADSDYQAKLASKIGVFLLAHAVSVNPVESRSTQPVSRYEQLGITELRGWR
jgi:hypothetical protein